jgi:hypothetical protein
MPAGNDRAVTPQEILANFVRLVGWLLAIGGLWFLAGGLRVVVSGRIDERRRSAQSIKRGIVLSIVSALMLCGGTWLADWVVK